MLWIENDVLMFGKWCNGEYVLFVLVLCNMIWWCVNVLCCEFWLVKWIGVFFCKIEVNVNDLVSVYLILLFFLRVFLWCLRIFFIFGYMLNFFG